MSNKLFLNSINNTPQSTPPIWFMRQAGRYHSHYREFKKKYSFEELCKNPELSAEIASGPIDEFDFETTAGGHGFGYYRVQAQQAVEFLIERLEQERLRLPVA